MSPNLQLCYRPSEPDELSCDPLADKHIDECLFLLGMILEHRIGMIRAHQQMDQLGDTPDYNGFCNCQILSFQSPTYCTVSETFTEEVY